MENKMTTQDKIKDIEDQLATLREQLEEENNKYLPFPQKGDKYWYFYTDGGVNELKEWDSNGRINAYRTKEEAEKAVIIAWAKHRVENEIKRLNDGWTPDWKDSNQNKYVVIPKGNNLGIDSWGVIKCLPTYMYLKTRELAKMLMVSHREDLLLMFSE